jgi:hypothetical protein
VPLYFAILSQSGADALLYLNFNVLCVTRKNALGETDDLFIPPLDGHIPDTHEVNATCAAFLHASHHPKVQARHVLFKHCRWL